MSRRSYRGPDPPTWTTAVLQTAMEITSNFEHVGRALSAALCEFIWVWGRISGQPRKRIRRFLSRISNLFDIHS